MCTEEVLSFTVSQVPVCTWTESPYQSSQALRFLFLPTFLFLCAEIILLYYTINTILILPNLPYFFPSYSQHWHSTHHKTAPFIGCHSDFESCWKKINKRKKKDLIMYWNPCRVQCIEQVYIDKGQVLGWDVREVIHQQGSGCGVHKQSRNLVLGV